jgi:hypothetical protein
MSQTFYSIVHDFVFDDRDVKLDPAPKLALIHRLIQFYHAALAEDSLREEGK